MGGVTPRSSQQVQGIYSRIMLQLSGAHGIIGLFCPAIEDFVHGSSRNNMSQQDESRFVADVLAMLRRRYDVVPNMSDWFVES